MHTDSSSSGLSYCCLGSHQTGLSSETGSTLQKEIFLRDNSGCQDSWLDQDEKNGGNFVHRNW